MKYGIIIIILVLILFVTEYKQNVREYFTTSRKVSDLDQRSYKVVSGFTNTQDAANRMSALHAFIIRVLGNLKKKYVINMEGTAQDASFVQRVLDRYNPDVLFENNPKMGEETSYVLNKGDKFAICLRSKNVGELGEFHDENILQFVALHEMTHLGTTTYGHNAEFWGRFRFMIEQAALARLHVPVDYSRKRVVYCGLPVTKNPYFG